MKASTNKPAAKAKPAAKKAAPKKVAVARKPVAAKKHPVAAERAAPHGMGIGAMCRELILKGKSTEEVVTVVLKKHPEAHTTASSVSWYRTKLRAEGKLE